MNKKSDVFQVVSSYGLDDFNYQEISDNERSSEIKKSWGIISEINKQCPGVGNNVQESESVDAERIEEKR